MRAVRMYTGFSALILFSLLAQKPILAAEKLPQPKMDGGTGVYSLLKERASGTRNAFPTGAISDTELSTILWAATGRNRDDKGFTIPLAGGKGPYVEIYVLSAQGAFLYDWKENALIEVVKGDIRDQVASGFAANAPCLLLFTADGKVIKELGGDDRARSFAYTAVGAMTQNIHLVNGDLGISGRYMASLNRESAVKALGINPDDFPICIMPLGKK